MFEVIRRLNLFCDMIDQIIEFNIMSPLLEEHWQEELQNAFDAGKRMAEKILG